MASTVGSLVVKLSAHIGEFTSGLQKAGEQARSFGSNMAVLQNVGGGTTLAFAGAGAAITGIVKTVYELTNSFLNASKAQNEFIAGTAVMAERLDMATEKWVALQMAAHEKDVEDLIGPALDVMKQRIGGGLTGNDANAQAFAKLGLNLNDLVHMDTADQFAAVAEAIKNLENPTIQAAMAMQIFGRGGKNLIPLLREGAAGLAEAARESERFGNKITDADGAVAKMARDSWRNFGHAVEGLWNTIAIGLAPALSELYDGFTNLAVGSRPLIEGMKDGFMKLADAFHWIRLVVESTQQKIMEFYLRIKQNQADLLSDMASAMEKLPDWLSGGGWAESAKGAHQYAKELEKIVAEHRKLVAKDWAGKWPSERAADARTKAGEEAKVREEMRAAPLRIPEAATNSIRDGILSALTEGSRSLMETFAKEQNSPQLQEMKKQTRVQEDMRRLLNFQVGAIE